MQFDSLGFCREHDWRYSQLSHEQTCCVYTAPFHPALTEDLDLLSRVVEPASGKRGPDPGCGGSVRDVYLVSDPKPMRYRACWLRKGQGLTRTQFVTEDMSVAGFSGSTGLAGVCRSWGQERDNPQSKARSDVTIRQISAIQMILLVMICENEQVPTHLPASSESAASRRFRAIVWPICHPVRWLFILI